MFSEQVLCDRDRLAIGEARGHLGQSLYLREIEGREEGAPPPVDLAAEKKNGDFIRSLIESGRIDIVHDVSDGGLLIAIAEMAMASGLGAVVAMNDASLPMLFGEDQGRYVIAASEDAAALVVADAKKANVDAVIIGTVGGSDLVLPKGERIAVAKLRAAHEDWFPKFMGDGLAL